MKLDTNITDLKIDQLIYTGKLSEASQILQQLESETLPLEEQVKIQLYRSHIQTINGNYEEGLSIAMNAHARIQDSNNHLLLLDALIAITRLLCPLGDFERCNRVIENGERIFSDFLSDSSNEIKQRKVILLYYKGRMHWKKGDSTKALAYLKDSLSLSKEINDQYHEAASLSDIGGAYWVKGEIDTALQNFQESLVIREKLGDKQGMCVALNNIGLMYRQKGDIGSSLKYHQRSLKISREIGNKEVISLNLGNIGKIFSQKGEIDQALDYYKQSLSLSEEIGNQHEILAYLGDIGRIYRQKCDFSQAFILLEKSLRLSEELDSRLYNSRTLFDLICLAIDMKKIELAKDYLKLLGTINNEEENKRINQYFRLGEALILKTSTDEHENRKSKELLVTILEEDVVDYSLTAIAVLSLCELFISEIRTSHEPERFVELSKYIDKLFEISKQLGFHWILIEILILKSKLALLELDYQGAHQLLIQGQILAQEKNLDQLAKKSSNELNLFQQLSEQWSYHIKEAPTLETRIMQTRLEDFIGDMKRKDMTSIRN